MEKYLTTADAQQLIRRQDALFPDAINPSLGTPLQPSRLQTGEKSTPSPW